MNENPTPRKPLRLWPGVAAAVLLGLIRFILPFVVPDAGMIAALGGLACALTVILWWLIFSRGPWVERLSAIALMGVALFATSRVIHKSIATGMMGMMLYMYAIPVLSLALVVG